jgi:hypothetical protein
VLFYFSVFKGASVDTCIIILEKDKQEENNFEFFISNKTDEINFIRNISQSSFSSNEKLYFNVSLSEKK